jgi:acetylornithine deacetylase/succinyl-diaminopimelate desuccinylase-like protein
MGLSETEKLARELIALPSVNPAFLPARHPRGGESRVADFLAATAAHAGLDVAFQKVLPRRSNLLATLSPLRPPRRRILLAPHLDTVNASSDGQFSPSSRRGRLSGRGACDTKGSIAAMVAALCQMARRGPRPVETEIVFAGLVDEENSQAGSRALAASGFKADLAIVGEPTRLKVVTAHKGSLWLRLETHGKAAHGARPDLGRNAVHEMARVIDWLQTDYARQLREKTHPVLGAATVSVGMVCGGTQPNIVPDFCRASVDRRTLPGETQRSVGAELRALLRQRKLRVSIDDDKQFPCLPLETDARLPLVRQLLDVAGQKTPAGVDYFCDASVLARAGIPSIVFGPGDIEQAHTADEWVSLRSLQSATAILARFLQALP